jgi:hypothetical protein
MTGKISPGPEDGTGALRSRGTASYETLTAISVDEFISSLRE